MAGRKKKAPQGKPGKGIPPHVGPERTRARRALSHVGGRVEFRGESKLEPILKRALDVSSEESSTRTHIHGFHSYPARLHPDTARTLIEGFSIAGNYVLDPFCGSGTVLAEACLLGRNALGRDVNPLAVALAKLKTQGSNEEERAAWADAAARVAARAERRREHKAAPTKRYPADDLELFEIHVLLELDSLKSGIQELEDRATRRVLFLALSSLLTKVSRRHGDSSRKRSERRLPSGYTLSMFEHRVAELGRRLRAFDALVPTSVKPPEIRKEDARSLRSVSADSIDLVVTSPPYPGVYDYFDHHAARLRWLGMDAGAFRTAEIGSRRQLNRLDASTAVKLWEEDFERSLRAIARVLAPGKLAALVVADTAVSGAVIAGDATTIRLGERAGLSLLGVASQKRPQFHFESEKTFGRDVRREHLVVLQKAMPGVFSSDATQGADAGKRRSVVSPRRMRRRRRFDET